MKFTPTAVLNSSYKLNTIESMILKALSISKLRATLRTGSKTKEKLNLTEALAVTFDFA